MELHRKRRPKLFKQVVGQPDAVRVLEDMLRRKEVPHAMLFTGPSGCGKTTLASIMQKKLECGPMDFTDLNAADSRGIEMVRDIRARMGLSPVSGKCRIWLIDECHALTKDAQSALLKMLEDTPSHVYFMLATTDPNKLLKTIITRCTEIRVKSISDPLLYSMLQTAWLEESGRLKPSAEWEDVVNKIVEVAEGSARKALVLLHAVMGLETQEQQLEAILSSDAKRQAYELARALLNPRTKWYDIAKIVKGIEEEPETVRRIILSYVSNVALGGKNLNRAMAILNAFRDHWFDCGRAGILIACHDVLSSK